VNLAWTADKALEPEDRAKRWGVTFDPASELLQVAPRSERLILVVSPR
jgi:hypothetical protein